MCCQSNKPLVRFTASSFFLLTILAYTCVIFTDVWPSNLDTVYRSAPSVSSMVANVCLAVWKVIGTARKSVEVKIKRKSFEMSNVSVFC